jgi:hypothetical protein
VETDPDEAPRTMQNGAVGMNETGTSWKVELKFIKTAKRATKGVSLFLVQRNELYFLPYLFDYYRRLGVENFLVYDDSSTDASLDFLVAQPDCTVITSDTPYGQKFGPLKRFVNVLKETAPDKFFSGQWVVTADADEFLILPSRYANLVELTKALDAAGHVCATAALIDFYPSRLSQRNHALSVSPFAANPFFDAGPLYTWTPGHFRPKMHSVGIRYRLMRMLNQYHPARFAEIYGNQAITALTFKVPLLKRGLGVSPNGDHDVTIAPQLDIVLALAHFKFYPGLDAKIRDAMTRKQYWSLSVDYKLMHAATELMNEKSLIGPESRIFLSPESLEQNGYLR